MRLLTSILSIMSFNIGFSQPSVFIHIDQFGYFKNAKKVAVLSNPVVGYNADLTYTPGITLEVVNKETETVVFTGPISIWNSGAIHGQSGDKGWWFDFSEWTTVGTYYIYDPLNEEKSAVFEINNNPYVSVLKQAGRMFYYNRCNSQKNEPFAAENWTDETNFLNPLQDANCRYVFDPLNEALEKDLSGGWFDAGDYNKYFSFAAGAVNDLLSAYENNPSAFEMDWNIPESGNAIPDILEEVKWELDWMIKMVNADGSAHLKQGSISYEENVATPPSENTDPRYYGPICTAASTAAAFIFAKAALVYREIPELVDYAAELEALAIVTYTYAIPAFLTETLETDCDDGTILSGDADLTVDDQIKQLLLASIYLFELTEIASYNDFVLENYMEVEPMSTGYWSYYNQDVIDGLLRYLTLPMGNEIVKTAITNSLTTSIANNYENYFGFTEMDLYRGFMPEYSYHWGSNLPKATVANLNLELVINELVEDTLSYYRKAEEQLHTFHGVNPLGIVYLSNMYDYGGDRCVNEIYHTWFWEGSIYDNALLSEKGPAPGYLTGGPNKDYEIESMAPPYGQPAQKSYLDFNDDWPTESYSISEPAIYYQAAYLRLLSYFVCAEEDVLEVSLPELQSKNQDINVFPNPSNEFIQLSGISTSVSFAIYDSKSNLIMRVMDANLEKKINVVDFKPGIYFIKIVENDGVTVKKFVKN